MLLETLISPITLCFVLGAFAAYLRSDLKLPEQVSQGLSIYLMLAISLKGGVALAQSGLAQAALPTLTALFLAAVIPLWCFGILRWLVRLNAADAAALAAHYGSVSAVTFLAALSYLDRQGIAYEGYATALLAVMELPAILVALTLAESSLQPGRSLPSVLRQTMTGKSVILLIGGLIIGYVIGPEGLAPVKPVFVDLFQGALCLFLLDLGNQAVQQARDRGRVGARLIAFGLLTPVINACLAILLCRLAGFSTGTSALLAVLSASASYIVAPAAIRLALPQANPGYYLTCSLAVTFPFNLLVGVPLYVALARWAG
jgi:hypothetical protein